MYFIGTCYVVCLVDDELDDKIRDYVTQDILVGTVVVLTLVVFIGLNTHAPS